MEANKKAATGLSHEEKHLLEQLRQHPKIRERVQRILEIADNTQGPLKTADQVEELLVEEMRRLGSATLHEWGARAEHRVSEELREQDPTVLSRKKKR